MESKPPPLGIPMNVYDHLGSRTLNELEQLLEADADIDELVVWLDSRVEAGTVPQIVADHLVRWNERKAASGEFMAEYERYTASRLAEWKPLGLEQPSPEMFGPSRPASSSKQPRNAPCPCGSGRKFKRCHGGPTAPN